MSYILEAGQRIGNYVLIRPLGQGGFSQVWQAAHHERPGRDYAVKVALEPALRQQLQSEGRLPDLEHPNIIAILDADTQHDPPYVVMPLAPGGDLAQAIRAAGPGGLPEARVRELIVGILEGLAFAHGQGVVHRDIKPGNILFDAEDRPMLADFGLSVHATPGAPGDQSVLRRSMALSTGGDAPGAGGHVVGTLAYMAPEVREGREATAASDIYSLGVMLFEMLVGRRPSGLELPSMARKGLEASALWDALYYWACNRPEERFAHAGEMLDAWRRSPKPIPFAAGSLQDLPPIPPPAPLPDDLNEALRVGWREIHQLKEQLAKTEKELAPLLGIYEDSHPEVQKKRVAVQAYQQSVTEAIKRFRELGAKTISNIVDRIAAIDSRRKALLLEGRKDGHPDLQRLQEQRIFLNKLKQDAEVFFERGWDLRSQGGMNDGKTRTINNIISLFAKAGQFITTPKPVVVNLWHVFVFFVPIGIAAKKYLDSLDSSSFSIGSLEYGWPWFIFSCALVFIVFSNAYIVFHLFVVALAWANVEKRPDAEEAGSPHSFQYISNTDRLESIRTRPVWFCGRIWLSRGVYNLGLGLKIYYVVFVSFMIFAALFRLVVELLRTS